jgi:hypothetical protein
MRIRTFKIFFQRPDNTKFHRIVHEFFSEDACILAEIIGNKEQAVPLWPFQDISPWRNQRQPGNNS